MEQLVVQYHKHTWVSWKNNMCLHFLSALSPSLLDKKLLKTQYVMFSYTYFYTTRQTITFEKLLSISWKLTFEPSVTKYWVFSWHGILHFAIYWSISILKQGTKFMASHESLTQRISGRENILKQNLKETFLGRPPAASGLQP